MYTIAPHGDKQAEFKPLDISISILGENPLISVRLEKGIIKIKYYEPGTKAALRKMEFAPSDSAIVEEDVFALVNDVYVGFGKVDDDFWKQLSEAVCAITGATLISKECLMSAATM